MLNHVVHRGLSSDRASAARSELSKQYKTRYVADRDRGHDEPLSPFFVGWHRANNTYEKNARRTRVILLLFLISTSVAPI